MNSVKRTLTFYFSTKGNVLEFIIETIERGLKEDNFTLTNNQYGDLKSTITYLLNNEINKTKKINHIDCIKETLIKIFNLTEYKHFHIENDTNDYGIINVAYTEFFEEIEVKCVKVEFNYESNFYEYHMKQIVPYIVDGYKYIFYEDFAWYLVKTEEELECLKKVQYYLDDCDIEIVKTIEV